MTLRNLMDTLYAWADQHHGVFPPFWVLQSEEFRSVLDDLLKMRLPCPPRPGLPPSDIKLLRCLNVTVVEFCGELPKGQEAFG